MGIENKIAHKQSMNERKQSLIDNFRIQSTADLDFVIGGGITYPVGMESSSPPEFRRRIAAAAASYQLDLKSIDYTLRNYIDKAAYEQKNTSLGDNIDLHIKDSCGILREDIRKIFQKDSCCFGTIGAEISLLRLLDTFDTARMLSNRGLLLEVAPILRLGLEMLAWAHEVYAVVGRDKAVTLKTYKAISGLNKIYDCSGKTYQYLSRFSHWSHIVHWHFISIEEGSAKVVAASVRYRAASLALCLVLIDIFLVVISNIYQKNRHNFEEKILDVWKLRKSKGVELFLEIFAKFSLGDLDEIKHLIQH